MSSLDSEAKVLRGIFLSELAKLISDAREAHQLVIKNPDDPKALERLRFFFHRISGSAAATNLHVLSHFTHCCERLVELATGGKVQDMAAIAALLGSGIAAASDVLLGKETAQAPQKGSLEVTTLVALPEATGRNQDLSKIMIVDDDPVSATAVRNCLDAAGFKSSIYCNPHEALRAIDEEQPDLIILDVMMPEVDGFELCRLIRLRPAMHITPIIFVTRKNDVEQKIRGLEVGGNDYIAKPFEPQELIARVRSHLHRFLALQEMAVRDGLTRCYNHRYFKMRLEQEVSRAQRYELGLTLALLDVDHFKNINDNFGHTTGDQVLSQMANIIKASVRSTDFVARYGGEEFAILLIEAEPREAEIVAKRMCDRIARHSFMRDEADGKQQHIPLTVSIGISGLEGPKDQTKALLERADSALYRAKQAGRNRVCL